MLSTFAAHNTSSPAVVGCSWGVERRCSCSPEMPCLNIWMERHTAIKYIKNNSFCWNVVVLSPSSRPTSPCFVYWLESRQKTKIIKLFLPFPSFRLLFPLPSLVPFHHPHCETLFLTDGKICFVAVVEGLMSNPFLEHSLGHKFRARTFGFSLTLCAEFIGGLRAKGLKKFINEDGGRLCNR